MTISGYTDIELFWRKIDIKGKDECWNIKLDRSRACKPYEGNTYRCTVWKGKFCGYHRIAWELTYGPIPEGMFVLHKCDNKRCANPNHLFLGTQGDNVRDFCKKYRRLKTDKGWIVVRR